MGLSEDIRRYAMAAVSSILGGLPESDMKRLSTAVLFGSAARGTATGESDIDVFFDVDCPESVQKAMHARINKLAGQFYLSQTALKYKMRGIDNALSVFVGRLEEWEDLKRSIAACGIVLYGPYKPKPPRLKPAFLLAWENVGPGVRGAFLNKMHGYRSGRRHYPGMIERCGGRKVGKAAVLVPAKHQRKFSEVFERYGINYTIQEVWVD